MIGVEAGKNLIPVLRIDAVIAFAQSSQISLSLNGKSTSLITAVLSLQHKTIALSTIMNQLPNGEWHSVFHDQLMSMAGAAG